MFPNATPPSKDSEPDWSQSMNLQLKVKGPQYPKHLGKISHCRKVNLSNNSLISLTLALYMETSNSWRIAFFWGDVFSLLHSPGLTQQWFLGDSVWQPSQAMDPRRARSRPSTGSGWLGRNESQEIFVERETHHKGGGLQDPINKKLLLYIGSVLERMKGLIIYSTPPGKQHIHYPGAFEDDFPFLWVGYVSSLEGKLIKYSTKGSFFLCNGYIGMH